MNKPDWKDAPPDATHLVQQPDGAWYWCTEEPGDKPEIDYVGGRGMEWTSTEMMQASSSKGWQETLEERP